MVIVMSALFGVMVWSSLLTYLAICRPKLLLRVTGTLERITYRLHPDLREGRRVLRVASKHVRVHARRRSAADSPVVGEVISALVNLGYGAGKARQIVTAVSRDLQLMEFDPLFRAAVQAIALESVGRAQVARAC